MRTLIPILALLVAAPLHAEVTLHPLFGDHMVLQRDAKIPVWGTAAPGEKVSVTLVVKKVADGQIELNTQSATADGKGDWKVELNPTAAATNCELRVAGSNKIALTGVAVGDVWLCSGQSNMEWKLKDLPKDGQGRKVADAATNANLRLFTVPNRAEREPKSTFPVSKMEGLWLECTPENVFEFSAVGYFFGREIEKTQKVPVGLIAADWGGTPCQAWTSKAGLEAEPGLKRHLDAWEATDAKRAEAAYQLAMAEWAKAVNKADELGRKRPPEPKKPVNGGLNAHTPTALFNGMIAPLVPFAIKGAIWYQGESNAGAANEYRTLFPAMIKDWRKQWGAELPFFTVQLAPYFDGDSAKTNYAELRDAQAFATKSLPKCGLAVITDVGDEKDIHPQRKEPVGTRLALAARAIAYGEKIDYSGPWFKEMKLDGGKAVLSFDHLGGGLVCKGETLAGFTMCGEDKKFHPAKAEIQGENVVVTCDDVSKPVAVRFGWCNFAKPELNFFNKSGLPAVPFRTDDFPLLTR